MNALLRHTSVLMLMLALAVWGGCMPQTGYAMPVGSHPAGMMTSQDSAAAQRIDTFFAREDVARSLQRMGISREQMGRYLGQLSESEQKKLIAKIDTVDAAGDSGLVVVLILLLIVVTVLYLTDYSVKVEPRSR